MLRQGLYYDIRKKDEGRTGSMKGSAEEYLFTKPYSIQIIKVLHVPVGLHCWGTIRWRIGGGEKRDGYKEMCACMSAKAAALGDSLSEVNSEWRSKFYHRSLFVNCLQYLYVLCVCFYKNAWSVFRLCGKWSETPQANSSVHLPFFKRIEKHTPNRKWPWIELELSLVGRPYLNSCFFLVTS